MTSLNYSWKQIIAGVAIGATIATLTACGGSSSSGTAANSTPIYTAIFDAGSSGTRLSFFKVTPGNGGYPVIEFIDKYNDKEENVPNDDGINDFLNNEGVIVLKGDTLPSGCPGTRNLGPTDVEPCVLQPLLQKLDQGIADLNAANPKLGLTKSQVKVELYATAGMRTEEKYNGGTHSASEIQQFYDQMKAYVAQWGYNAGEFKTLNGNSEEGLWSWINLNDQYFNAFGGNTTYWTQAPTTYGNFEVGGSSMQIAFPTTKLSPSTDGNVYPVTINGRSYNVFSKTYLGLGGDDARKFMRSYGYQGAQGYNGGADCFGSQATDANTKESSGIRLFNASFYPNSTTIQGNTVDNTWAPLLTTDGIKGPLYPALTGALGFNSTTCSGKYQDIINSVMSLPRNSYGTFPNQQTPSSYASFIEKVSYSSSPFIGIDGFWWVADFLGLTNKANPLSPYTQADFEAKYNAICNQSYTGTPSKNLDGMRSCADATYMRNFLWRTSGLFTSANGASFVGSAPNSFKKDGVTNDVLTWTRGYLLWKYAN